MIPLIEVVGSVKVPPAQIAGIWLNAGIVEVLFTVTVMVVVAVHPPGFGVKVYVVVAILLIAGLHVPEIPLVEVAGSVNDCPEQIGVMALKVGTVPAFTVTVIVAVAAHCDPSGVNV